MDTASLDLAKIIPQYRDRIYRLALSILHNRSDAEDVLQNTLIKISRKISGFKNHCQLSTWIYRIAYNESLMFLRKKRSLFRSINAYKKYTQKFPAEFRVNWPGTPDKALLDGELKQRIESAFRDLPICYRMPVLLHNIEELPLIDVARILKLTTPAVKARLHRAYLKLRDQIDGYFNDKPEYSRTRPARCGVWTRFVFDYANKKLETEKKVSFETHLSDCPECKVFLDSYLDAIRITGALECPDLPAALKKEIDKIILPRKKH